MNFNELPRDEYNILMGDKITFPVQLDLITPIQSVRGEIKQLIVNEPTVEQLEIASKEKGEIKQTIRLMSLSLDLADEDIRKLRLRDDRRVKEVMSIFL